MGASSQPGLVHLPGLCVVTMEQERQAEGGKQWGYKLSWGSLILTVDLAPHRRGDLMEVVAQQVICVLVFTLLEPGLNLSSSRVQRGLGLDWRAAGH